MTRKQKLAIEKARREYNLACIRQDKAKIARLAKTYRDICDAVRSQ